MNKLVINVAYLLIFSYIIYADDVIQCPKQCQCSKNNETGLIVRCENITDLKDVVFGNISSEIVYLNLSSNFISKLDSDSFTGNFTKLTKLDVANNHLTNIFEGAFDELTSLKFLDISANPLACNCELLWILDYTRLHSIKLKPPPKCQTPDVFTGHLLRKIRIGEDIHCSQSTSLQQQLELIPDKDQLIFEGDSLTLICRAPRIALSMRDHEDFALKSNVYWGWSEKIVPPNSKEDLFIENPKDKFPSVLIDEKVISNLGILQSVLKIPYVTRNHSGLYDCTMQQQKGESLAKRVSVLVISDKTKYCLAQETSDNKGRFSWPRTIRGNTVKLPCSIEGVASSIASRKCNENGSWEEIDASNCPFIHETTRVLEQFSKVNLTIPRGNVLESAKRLMAFTAKEFIKERFRDPMDVVFIGKTVENYIEFIHMEKDLSSFIMEIVSNVMEFPKSLLDQAQILDRTSSKLIDAAEKAASHTTSAESQKSNLAIELFQIPNDIYVGISCSWIKQENSKQFLCNTASKSHPNFANIDASIQFPATQYSGSQTHRLLVSVYNNNKFFHQNKSQGSYLVTSNIIGAKLVPPTMMSSMIPKNLSEPIFIALKAAPFHDEISQPKVVWWDESMNDGTGGWSFNHGCQSFHYIQGIFMFTCNRLGFYALVQHSSALNDFLNEDSGARFKLSPIGFYVGTLIIFFTAWLNIVTYIFFFDRIIMGRRVKHSLINTWISMAMLAFIFAVGIYQTENSKVCQFFGVTIHYLSLCVLLWICVSVSNMYKRVSRNDRIGMEDELPREEPRVKKPILGLYLLGYGVGLLICGINSAVNLKEYASYTHCFMDTSSELGALLLPSSILLFFLLIMFICIRFHLRNRVICNTHLSEGGTEALEIDLLESSHAVNAARSVRSFSTQPTHTSLEDLEASPRTQLKSYIIVLVLYLLTWLSAAVAVSIPFNERLIYEEEIFSIAFAIFSMLLGCFISFFYGFARSDVRSIWSQFKCCGKIQKTIVPKEYEQTTTTSVMYHQPMNLSRSNSQNSRGRPLSVGSIRLKSANDLNDTMSKSNGGNFMMTMQRHQMSVYSDDTSTVEMFYNPNQSNAARRFFKKQKRLQKLNNIDVQRRCDFNDNSSDISSTIMSVSKPVSEMFGTSSKVNNTNIHVDENKMKNKQFSNSVMSDSCNESELFMDICNEGLRFSTLKSKINNTDSKMYTNFFENQSTIQEVLKKKIEEKQKSSLETSKDVDPPLYMNTRSLVGKTIQEVNETSDHDNELPPLTVKLADQSQAMNTVGLPSPPKQDEENNELQLDLNATYISAPLEISGKSQNLMPTSQKPAFKSKSLDHLNVISSVNYQESHTRSISFNNITFIDHDGLIPSEITSSTNIEYRQVIMERDATSMLSNPEDSISPPILVAPSLCDIDQLDDQGSFQVTNKTCNQTSMDNLLNNHHSNPLDYTPILLNPDNTPNFSIIERNSSPTGFSDINLTYQNSELSSQDLYAPADIDLNYMLAERDHFRISDDEDDDNGNSDFNCSRDLLIHPCQTDEDGIDQLYEQVRGNDLSSKLSKPPPPPKPKNIKVTRHYVFQHPTLLSPDDDDSSIIP